MKSNSTYVTWSQFYTDRLSRFVVLFVRLNLKYTFQYLPYCNNTINTEKCIFTHKVVHWNVSRCAYIQEIIFTGMRLCKTRDCLSNNDTL